MNSVKCVFLVALKQEVPSCFRSRGLVYSIKQLVAERKSHFDSSILCIITGVGKDAISSTFRYISTYLSPQMVVNFGSAGSTVHSVGQYVIPKSVCCLDNDFVLDFPVYPFISNETFVYADKLTTVQTVNPKDRFELVDMEAFWIAQESRALSCPFYCIKYVSDSNSVEEFYNTVKTIEESFERLFAPLFDLDDSVSVIIPTYNRAGMLKRAIDSVLNQSVSVDLIVVDDASCDETSSVLALYKDQIQVIKNDRNMGVSYSRNRGVEIARSRFIAFLDSDDEWHVDKIKHQLDYLFINPFFNIIQCDEKWIRNNKQINKKKYHLKEEGFIFKQSLERCMVSPSGVMIKKKFFDQFSGFNETFQVCEDYDLWIKMTRFFLVGFNSDLDVNKFAGHSDQLSLTPVMDKYRVQSLEQLYRSETSQVFKDYIFNVLSFKKTIYETGLQKRLNL